MNAFAKPGLAEEKLPPVSSADNGKVLGVNNGVWDKVAASGGTTVVANPTLAGTEADLTGLQVGDIKYKVPEGGGGVTVLNYTTRPEEDDGANYIVYTLDKTYAEILSAYQSGIVLIKATDYAFLSVIAVAGGVTSVSRFSNDYFDKYQADGMDSYPELWVLSPF